MSIFPDDTIENTEEINETLHKEELKLYKEYAIDFDTGQFLYDDTGKNIIVGKNEAIKIWIWKVLQTSRNRYLIYSSNYGHDFETIIGKGYNKNLINSELERLIEECLLANPYITEILEINTDFKGSKLYIYVTVKTVYGTVNVDV
ncbi:terminase [Clostridium botulinum]